MGTLDFMHARSVNSLEHNAGTEPESFGKLTQGRYSTLAREIFHQTSNLGKIHAGRYSTVSVQEVPNLEFAPNTDSRYSTQSRDIPPQTDSGSDRVLRRYNLGRKLPKTVKQTTFELHETLKKLTNKKLLESD